jgi:hypothetical protein
VIAHLITNGLIAVLTAHFLLAILSKELFTPELQHHATSYHYSFSRALREAIRKLHIYAEGLENDEQVDNFLSLWADTRVALLNYLKHQEEVLFVAYRKVLPGITVEAEETLDKSLLAIEAVQVHVDRLKDERCDRREVLTQLSNELKHAAPVWVSHLDWVDVHLSFIPRKYIPSHWHKELARAIFHKTNVSHWQRIAPFIITHLYRHSLRVEFLHSLQWAVPERIQEVGSWLINGVDPFLYDRLLVEVPELAPRGTTRYIKIW